jgi:hypothetical protein
MLLVSIASSVALSAREDETDFQLRNKLPTYADLQKQVEELKRKQQEQQDLKGVSTAASILGGIKSFSTGAAFGIAASIAPKSQLPIYKNHGRVIAGMLGLAFFFNEEGNIAFFDQNSSWLSKALNATGFIVGYFGPTLFGGKTGTKGKNGSLLNPDTVYWINGQTTSTINGIEDKNLNTIVGTFKGTVKKYKK